MNLKLLLKYPTVIKKQDDTYEGYLEINETDYFVSFREIHLGSITLNWDKSTRLLPFRKEIEDIVNTEDTLDALAFLEQLERLIRQSTDTKNFDNVPNNYRGVINDYYEFCKFYEHTNSSISADLSKITLQYRDESNRKHILEISVIYNNSNYIYNIQHSPISSFELEENNATSLITVYNTFSNAVESSHIQSFFDILDEIDRTCWVLDPEKPSYKENFRRIVIETNTSAILTVYEKNARCLPEIKILGSQLSIKYFTEKIDEHFDKWDPENNIIEELLKLLEITSLPSKPELNPDDDVLLNEGECCICFAMRLDDILPEVACSNTSCNQIFHQKCLYRWLEAIKSRLSVYEIYGPCPNCEKGIHCPIAQN